MKNLTMVAVLTAICCAAQGQDTRYENAVKINPLSLIFATGNVAYERAVSPNQSVQLGIFFSGVSISDVKYSGLGITPEYRFYVAGRKEALNGVYVGPFLRYQRFSLKDKETDDEAKYSSFGGGAVIGWEKSWESGFVLDIFVGPSYNSGEVKESTDGDDFDVAGSIDGFGIRTGITLGFAF
jgi:hypothetical protein